MKIIDTEINEIKIIEPRIFYDERGYFFESFVEQWFTANVCNTRFVQDNESQSTYGVLRGLHFQKPPYAQAKLVRVVIGKVLDIVVDIRKESHTFGKYVAVELNDKDKRQLFIPKGFAHGYITLSEKAIFQYKCDNYYAPQSEGGILWNDPELGIDWRISEKDIILSEKDKKHPLLHEI